MAAEKLTKHRLAQILITLSVLIAVFFWRTITYKEITNVECDLKPKCSIFVNGQEITVTKDDTYPQTVILHPIKSGWHLEYDGQMITEGNQTKLILDINTPETNHTLVINEKVKIRLKL